MQRIETVVVTLDGESKCGKTTAMDAIGRQLARVQRMGQRALEISHMTMSGRQRKDWRPPAQSVSFSSVTQISAGNFYRAATALVIREEARGGAKTQFYPEDTSTIEAMLRENGMEEVLQNDPAIGQRVSTVAKFAGVQALCGSLFANKVQQAFHAGSGANLVLADARDPVGHLRRNNKLGFGHRQIHPGNVVPLYIHTPPEVGAGWLKGDYRANLELIESRRRDDRERAELPVIIPKPHEVVANFPTYRAQLLGTTEPAMVAFPLLVANTAETTLQDVEHLGERVVHLAHDTGMLRHHRQNTPVFI